MSKWKWQ